MELGTIIGFGSGIFFIIMSMLITSKFNVVQTLSFIDPPSVMITIGGAIASMFVAYPLNKIIATVKATSLVIKPPKVDAAESIDTIIKLANLARREGILALEESASNMDDAFMKKGVMLIVDGTDPELVRSILETELAYIDGRHGEIRGVWDFFASIGPGWGMIGTLIGLILMLKNMSDPSSIGPNMGVALITTFYGSLLANFVATPIANKMKTYSGDEMLVKEVMIEGMLSIQAGENPRIIEEKLKAFLSPASRDSIGAEKQKKEAGE